MEGYHRHEEMKQMAKAANMTSACRQSTIKNCNGPNSYRVSQKRDMRISFWQDGLTEKFPRTVSKAAIMLSQL